MYSQSPGHIWPAQHDPVLEHGLVVAQYGAHIAVLSLLVHWLSKETSYELQSGTATQTPLVILIVDPESHSSVINGESASSLHPVTTNDISHKIIWNTLCFIVLPRWHRVALCFIGGIVPQHTTWCFKWHCVLKVIMFQQVTMCFIVLWQKTLWFIVLEQVTLCFIVSQCVSTHDIVFHCVSNDAVLQ